MMRHRWLITTIAAAPIVAALVALQSCGGVGGPTSPGGGGLPDPTAAFLALLPAGQSGATYIGAAACAAGTCHGGTTDTSANYSEWTHTKHHDNGVTCERCHGPGSVHAANPTTANILTFPKLQSIVVCQQCHGPIVDQYEKSKHNQLLEDPINLSNSNQRSSRCILCHSGLVRTEVYEAGLDIGSTTDVPDATLTQLKSDTLDVVPTSAACATCHDPHAITGNLDADGEEHQVRHLLTNTDTSTIVAPNTAATFTAFNHQCAECHNGRATDPSKYNTATRGTHPAVAFNMLMGVSGYEGNAVVQRNQAHATVEGQCSKCHMPDANHSFNVSFDVSCAPCHSATDAANRADTIKSDILGELVALRTRMQNWSTLTFSDPDLWDFSSNITAEGKTPPDQSLVADAIKKSRFNYWYIVNAGDYGVHNAPYAKTLITVANDALDNAGIAVVPQGRKAGTAELLKTIEADRARNAVVQGNAD